jgi:hypothetical protein
MKKQTLSFLSAALLAGAFSAPAHAATEFVSYWSSVGAGCVPTGTSIQANSYLVTGGSVKPQASDTSRVVLTCPVSINTGADRPNWLYLSYRDSSGAGNRGATYVKATLWKKNRDTGTLSTVVSVTSDDHPETGDVEHKASFDEILTFTSHHYYVYVDFDRTSTAETISFRGTSLGYSI